MERILLVEDDRQLSFITKRMLESKGYEVTNTYTVEQAKAEFIKNHYDLIVLDMMLPDGEGTEVCQYVRERSVCPVIFVSCLSDNMTKIGALELGGDDYVVKPVNYDELITRIQVNIRRAKQYNQRTAIDEEVRFPGFLLKKKMREAWITDENGMPKELMELSPIEYALLQCLVDNAGELMLYQDLFRQVWQAEDMGDVRTVMVHVSNLRKKMGDCGRLIHTVRSAGYIFKE